MALVESWLLTMTSGMGDTAILSCPSSPRIHDTSRRKRTYWHLDLRHSVVFPVVLNENQEKVTPIRYMSHAHFAFLTSRFPLPLPWRPLFGRTGGPLILRVREQSLLMSQVSHTAQRNGIRSVEGSAAGSRHTGLSQLRIPCRQPAYTEHDSTSRLPIHVRPRCL